MDPTLAVDAALVLSAQPLRHAQMLPERGQHFAGKRLHIGVLRFAGATRLAKRRSRSAHAGRRRRRIPVLFTVSPPETAIVRPRLRHGSHSLNGREVSGDGAGRWFVTPDEFDERHVRRNF